MDNRPLIVAISGASGAILGIETLRACRDLGVPTHLIVTEAGARTIALETDSSVEDVRALATESHANKDIGATIASGSFRTRGMVCAPCSIKTLSGIAGSYSHNLTIRAADVCLKQRLPVVLMVRETPLHPGHLDLMARAARLGCHIVPPVPAFYAKPATIDDMVRHTVGRVLDLFGIAHNRIDRWSGT
ncbi:MAG: UbiX family flavin prenyltransferase [Alphaproteobacteria bacterium]|nr:UbiX family flavin prenyltransferase [Alphaproteobacteria bacterium]MBF0250572.1 UbiX family flavin prenyltransferase [Alphaproteobacteria bacterium]